MTAIMIFIRSLAFFVVLSFVLHLLFPELDILTIVWAAIMLDVSFMLYPRSN